MLSSLKYENILKKIKNILSLQPLHKQLNSIFAEAQKERGGRVGYSRSWVADFIEDLVLAVLWDNSKYALYSTPSENKT